MKSILEFNLPDDSEEFEAACNGRKYALILWEIDQWLRAKTKYAPDTMTDEEYRAYELCRNELRDLINDAGVKLF